MVTGDDELVIWASILPIDDVEDQLDELPNVEENSSGKSEILTACL